jgi:hypothetical protein
MNGYFCGESKANSHLSSRIQTRIGMAKNPIGIFTKAKFRQFQAACLLCSSAERAKFIRRAEPLLVTAISRLAHILFAGVPLAALAATVGVIFSISTDLRRRLLSNRALDPLRGKKSLKISIKHSSHFGSRLMNDMRLSSLCKQ